MDVYVSNGFSPFREIKSYPSHGPDWILLELVYILLSANFLTRGVGGGTNAHYGKIQECLDAVKILMVLW